ncbi:MAG: hypothetical protein J7527_07540 [Chitinophagaceae bacterium]|nr:hypothetical protein [Chitinophagaceae bacterium]
MNNNKDNKHEEGPVTEFIENYTAKVPSSAYLVASVAAMATSLTLKCMGRKHDALFVGQWAAPFLLLGIYNKLVKQSGHDADSKQSDKNSQQ